MSADVRPVTETFVYDGLSRPTAVASDSASSAFTYNLMSAIPTATETQSVGPVTLNPVVRTYSHGGRPKTMAYPGGRAVEMHYNVAGQLNTINDGGATVADYDYIGGRVGRRVLGGAVRMTLAYTPATSVGHVTGVTHTKVSGGATLENWSLGWDAVFNKTVRNDVARSVPHGYSYDALDRLSNYTLDAAGNRAGAGYTVTGLHEYSASPYGNFGYDANGNLHELTSVSEEYIYDAQDRLVEHWVTGTTAHDDISTTIPANYTTLAGTWSASGGYLHETGASWGRILRSNVPADLSDFSFGYLSTHDPEDPSHAFDPEYYALAMLRVDEDPGTGEWTYLALVIEPNRLSLREWVDDAVTELDSVELTSAQDAWYRVKVTLGSGGAVTVYHGVQGGTLIDVLSGTTSITGPGDVGFGVGDHGDYWFDDVRFASPTVSSSSIGVRYAYDAYGRRVAQTVYAPDGAAATTYFVYDGDRVVEEVDADGNVLASYIYGQYVDEVLQMRRSGNDYYYLHDDQYNVLGLTDNTGTLVERYAYGDFGDPTIYDGSGTPLSETAVGNRYLFNGREWDADLGLYHYRTRYMDPKLGRFVSRDTIGLWGDSNNLGNPYTYLGNNPWSGVDPYGEGLFDVVSTPLEWFYRDERVGSNPNYGINRYRLNQYVQQSAAQPDPIFDGTFGRTLPTGADSRYAPGVQAQLEVAAGHAIGEMKDNATLIGSFVAGPAGAIVLGGSTAIDIGKGDYDGVVITGVGVAVAGGLKKITTSAAQGAEAAEKIGQVHHLATNKNWVSTLRGGPWSPRFDKLFRKAGLTLEDVANKIAMPGHAGPHSEAYHEAIYDRLTKATRSLSGEKYKDALMQELTLLANEVSTPGTAIHRLLIRQP